MLIILTYRPSVAQQIHSGILIEPFLKMEREKNPITVYPYKQIIKRSINEKLNEV
jgi:hypothetical protein